jgi:hypothetical protein
LARLNNILAAKITAASFAEGPARRESARRPFAYRALCLSMTCSENR